MWGGEETSITKVKEGRCAHLWGEAAGECNGIDVHSLVTHLLFLQAVSRHMTSVFQELRGRAALKPLGAPNSPPAFPKE